MGSARQEDLDERYTHGHHESVLRSHRWRTVENSSNYLAQVLKSGDLVLDLGCGPGNLSADLAKKTGATVLGLDNASAAIAAAQGDFGGTHRVSFCVGDGYQLPFADNTFDGTHAHQVLQHSKKPLALLSELYRVTKPGGALGVRDATYSAFRWSPKSPGLDRWLSLYLDLARENEGEPDAGDHLASWVKAAQFRDLQVTETTWNYDDPATCTWWGGLWADRILASNFGAQLKELGWTSPSELEELAQAFRAWSTEPGAWFKVPSTEVLAYK
ncbi:MAG: methyltransferase domain-containing protein [Actinomycetes bacterium]